VQPLAYSLFPKVDAARTYCGGTCEEYLGKIDWKGRGLKMETKLVPRIVSGAKHVSALHLTNAVEQAEGITHSPEVR
jgi:hypothetical protein